MEDLSGVLKRSLKEFIEKHRNELPRYIVVDRSTTFKNIIKVLRESIDYGGQGAEVIVVVDKSRRPVGIIEDLELIEILSSRERWTFSILKPIIRRRAKDLTGLLSLSLDTIAKMRHPLLRYDSTIKEALDLMSSFKSRYVIVIDEEDRLYSIISSRNILTDIVNELSKD